jgi:hypothetical protein
MVHLIKSVAPTNLISMKGGKSNGYFMDPVASFITQCLEFEKGMGKKWSDNPVKYPL